MKTKFFDKDGIPNCFALKKYRLIQRLTGVHYIHHIRYAYGIKMPFCNWSYFPAFHKEWLKRASDGEWNVMRKGWAETPWRELEDEPYHNCTATGNY